MGREKGGIGEGGGKRGRGREEEQMGQDFSGEKMDRRRWGGEKGG